MNVIKFNSLELYKNKTVLLVVFLFYCVFANAQDVVKETVAEKKSIAEVSLNQRFAAKVLNAYQENSKTKIDDLFSQFQMLTDAGLPNDLKKEVVKNIYLAFKNPNEIVIDFTSDTFEKITLQQLIQKLLVSKPILFSVSNAVNYNSVDFNSWKIDYTIVRTKLGIESKINVVQKVYFYETQKDFGSNKKTVLATFLGAM